MGREHRIISALQDTDVPVAAGDRPLRRDGDDPFYVMGWVEGPILRSMNEAESFPDPRASGERSASGWSTRWSRSTRSTPIAVGLGDLAKKEDYVARQLHRWQGQWEKQHTRELPLVDEVHDRLAARIPDQGPATIVHGDYRLDNMILSPAGEVAAVVDWELCTLGDPLADVGLLLVYWGEEGDELIPLMRAGDDWRRGFPVARARSGSATPSAPAATSPRSTSTSRSASGSWRSCSRGSSRATRAGQYGDAERLRRRSVRAHASRPLVGAADEAVDRLD